MVVDKLEDTLNGGYAGLVGEVVEYDIYRMKKLEFVPDVIFDLGANVGVFARFCRSLFPKALIICVEPDTENFRHLVKFTPYDRNIYFFNWAIGVGPVYRKYDVENGAHESYTDLAHVEPGRVYKISEVETIMINELVAAHYYGREKKYVMKIDIEGNEGVILDDMPSMNTLKRMDYITMEIHNEEFNKYLKLLEGTHNCELDKVNFWATKK